MDHLPIPVTSHKHVSVPDLDGEEYDYNGFHDFPLRHGWSDERISQAAWDPQSRLEAAKLIQTWLFFGLLGEGFGVHVPRQHFSHTDSQGRKWITTAKLPEYVKTWNHRSQPRAGRQKLAERDYLSQCIGAVVSIFQGKHQYSLQDIVGPEIELSIIILIGTLDWCRVRIYGPHDSQTDAQPSLIEHMGDRTRKLLTPKLVENGWCPNLIGRLNRMVGFSGMYYATLLGPVWKKNDHHLCRKDTCRAEIVDETKYKTKHATDDCECSHIGPNPVSLSAIIDRGSIPLLSMDEQVLQMMVIPSRPDTSYVAISHVWSDGLGNPENNTLPQCQIQLLRKRINEIQPPNLGAQMPRYFWIDSLCVPLRPHSARIDAIKTMHRVYKNASCVLVLDAELIHSSSLCNPEEIYMRMILCTWFRRLWTLQEGASAKSLFIQFKERSVDINALSDATYRLFDIHDEIAYRSHSILIQPWLIFNQPSHSAIQFSVVMQCLQGRSTSKPADEPICVATLLGMDVKTLAEEHDEKRMAKFWSLRMKVPFSLVFINGPRLKVDGYRWALSTFLQRKNPRLVAPDMGLAHCTPQGLVLTTSGIIIRTSVTSSIHRFFRFRETSSQIRYVLYMEPGNDNPAFQDVELRNIELLAVVLRERVNDSNIGVGILASVSRQEDINFVTYIGIVRILKEGGVVDQLKSLAKFYLKESPDSGSGEDTAINQVWCIR
jgi:hypothetical protein